MSVVTAVILMTGLPGSEEGDVRLLDAVNGFFEDPDAGLLLVLEVGGTKHPQAVFAAGGMSHLNVDRFLAHLLALDWRSHDIEWAQVAIKGEDNDGFGIVELYRGPFTDPAWTSEPTP